ncbi:hypothetical protein [Marilutibacter alkalisoli]|uniref:Uncharacterized protein n=1 Tax=Marilutibacter alkalisoli TaxID=2591633 RepID=A0A514BQS2_9GAMM|nr:hypothetical protein [Lysobacter alkalisoli]QDH69706.1 hypothetical protein FKV23_06045 [Lysobacter alkalisoli]
MTKHLVHLGLLTSLLFPAMALATPIGPITKIVVTETGVGPKNEGCASFAVTPNQIRAFFDKAVLISGRQQHDFFLHGPCAARGTLETRYDTWHWEIRNMGTGSITATNGDTFLLADPSQESSLAGDSPGP